jgi:hypothetical protein
MEEKTMTYARTTTVDAAPAGDTVRQSVLDVDTDLTGIYANLNTHETATTDIHGAGSGTLVSTTGTQTLTAKTISGATITGAVDCSGATLTSPTVSGATITGTIAASGATISGATITGGTITGVTFSSPTLTSASDTAYGASWNGVTNVAPSKNAVYDQMELRYLKTNTTIGSDAIEVNAGGSGNRLAFIDFHGDDTYTDYGLRLIRGNTGENATSSLIHRGTGNLVINANEAAPIVIQTTNTTRAVIAAAGTVSLASQPLFIAQATSGGANCCGDILSVYNLLAGSSPALTWTEITDRASNFSGGTFTAPVTGSYLLSARVAVDGITGDHSWFTSNIVTSNRIYEICYLLPQYSSISGSIVAEPACFVCDMDAGDTAYLQIAMDGSAKVVDISLTQTFFMGYLLP